MNSNTSLKNSIDWNQMPDSNLTVATFTDSGEQSDSDLCNFLSAGELQHAATLQDMVEKRHYLARRCFQRLFLSAVLENQIAPEDLALIHQRDTRPQCSDAPNLHLSFSSSGTTAIACASSQPLIGVDIERHRKVENAIALAKRHFTTEEADVLAQLPKEQQNLAFLHYWTAKEAGLKAIGKGIVFGLNTFTVQSDGAFSFKILGPPEYSQGLRLQYLEIIPQHVIALVEINSVGNI
jgi:phosphopantetheinyl transferase